jgi:hypothetical protein
LEDVQKWLSAPNESIHLLICHGFKTNAITTPTKPSKSMQQSNSPAPPTRHNGISSKVTSPVYANTTNQPPPPPVPAKPKYRSPNAQFVPINGDNHTPRRQSQNGFEVDEVNYFTFDFSSKIYFFV